MKKKTKHTKNGKLTKLTLLVTCKACGGGGHIRIADLPALRKAREQKDITVRGMAKRLKLSAPFISDVELGRRACPEHVLKAYQKL